MKSKKTVEKLSVCPSDLVGYMLKSFHDGEIRIILKFRGILNEETLASAVRLTLDCEPVLGCRFIEKPLRPYWRRCSNLESAFEFHKVDGLELKRSIDRFLLVPLNPFRDPQVKVGLFRADFDTLYVKMSHIVADGGASAEYLGVLSSLYRALQKQRNFAPSMHSATRGASLQPFMRVGLPKLLKSITSISVPKSTWQFLQESDGLTHSQLIVRHIQQEKLEQLKAYAKNHNVTLGDILTTAYYRALCRLIDPPENIKHALLIPVNARKKLSSGKMGSARILSATYFVTIERRREESFEQTLAKVHASMVREKLKQSELGMLFLIELALAPGSPAMHIFGRTVSRTALLPEFSNIGVVDGRIADFGVPVEEVLPVGPAMYPPHFCLGSSTFNNKMALNATICGTDDYRKKVENFFDFLVEELPVQKP